MVEYVYTFKFARQFQMLDKNAEKELARIEKSFAEPQVKLVKSSFFLHTDLENTQEIAEKMVQALREGKFFQIAQQYSAAGSAQRGGNVGWVFADGVQQS